MLPAAQLPLVLIALGKTQLMRNSSHASKRKMLYWKRRVALLFLTRQNGALEKKEEKSAQVAISMGSPSSFVVDTALGAK